MSSILLFDSGIGGLSVLEKVHERLPDQDLHYVADHAAYPYGDKEEHWLTHRVDKLISHLNVRFQPNVIVIACNTASTVILPTLRSHISTPIVGVIPAIKTAAQVSQNKKIGLLATPGTVAREYTDDLIREFADHCVVSKKGSTQLVHLAEKKLNGEPINPEAIKAEIQDLIDAKVDTIVLGCTHFPLLRNEIQNQAPGITLVDSGEAIAKRTETLLGVSYPSKSHPTSINIQTGGALSYYSTRPITASMKANLTVRGFTQFEQLPFDLSASA